MWRQLQELETHAVYLSTPLLIDPTVPVSGRMHTAFHVRAQVVCSAFTLHFVFVASAYTCVSFLCIFFPLSVAPVTANTALRYSSCAVPVSAGPSCEACGAELGLSQAPLPQSRFAFTILPECMGSLWRRLPAAAQGREGGWVLEAELPGVGCVVL